MLRTFFRRQAIALAVGLLIVGSAGVTNVIAQNNCACSLAMHGFPGCEGIGATSMMISSSPVYGEGTYIMYYIIDVFGNWRNFDCGGTASGGNGCTVSVGGTAKSADGITVNQSYFATTGGGFCATPCVATNLPGADIANPPRSTWTFAVYPNVSFTTSLYYV